MKHLFIITASVALCLVGPVSAQQNQKAVDVRELPYVERESKDSKTMARIEIDIHSTVEVSFGPERRMMTFFTKDNDPKRGYRMLFDLDLDGTWDCRKFTLTHENEILVDDKWVKVGVVKGLPSGAPVAVTESGDRYQFKGRAWIKE
jgi:hypothetical protein